MAYSPVAITAVYDHVIKVLPSMKRSGVYANKSGYHNSRKNLLARAVWRFNYSVREAVDRQGDEDAASAIDMTMNTPDLRKATQRLLAAAKARDPRLVGKIREFFGSLDGKVVTGWSILKNRAATANRTHLWHLHISGHRKYANDRKVWLGVAEIICGYPAGTLTGDRPVVDPVDVEDMRLVDLLSEIKTGTKSSAVMRTFQRGLIALGFPVGPDGADGLWGPATKAAVTRLQIQKLGADPGSSGADGIPGAATFNMVMAAAAKAPVKT